MKRLINKLIVCSALPLVAANASDKPNVLYILTDQQSFNMMSCMGNKYLSTPNMDRLAKQGYRFDKNYVANPVSQPSRFSLMTGRFASDVNTRGNNDNYNVSDIIQITSESSIGKLFKNNGYETYYSGKTHLYSEDMSLYGFTLNSKSPYDEPAQYAETFFPTRKQAVKPFLLVVSFMNPHDISYDAGFDARFPDGLSSSAAAATKKYLNIKDGLTTEEYQTQVPPPPTNQTRIDAIQASVTTNGSGYRNWSDAQWDQFRWMYYKLTEEVDGQIGRVLDALDDAGLTDNTIIVFTSDHGEFNQSHGLVHKTYMFEESQRTPLIFSGKGIDKDKINDSTLVCNGTDIVPTICDLTGIPIPLSLYGISLKSYLSTNDDVKATRDFLVTESGLGFQITDGRYKYTIMEFARNPDMLFDLKNDSGETNNLTDDPNYSSIKADLRVKLIANLASRGVTIGIADKYLLKEDFDYDANRPLILNPAASSANKDVVTGWSTQNNSSSNTNCFNITDGGLSYESYNSSATGNALLYNGVKGQAVFKSFSSNVADDMNVYISFLINFSNVSANGSDYFLGLKNSTSATAQVFGGRIFAKVNPENPNKEVTLGINKASSGTTIWQDSNAGIPANKTHLFVMKYHVGALFGSNADDEVGQSDDIMSLYINPTTGSAEPSSPNLIHFDTNQSDLYRYSSTGSVIGGASGLYLRTPGSSVAPSYVLDDIRVGLTWSDVIQNVDIMGFSNPKFKDFLYNLVNKHLILDFSNNNFNSFDIFSIAGNKIKVGKINSLNENIDLSSLKRGIYILNLNGINKTALKLIIP